MFRSRKKGEKSRRVNREESIKFTLFDVAAAEARRHEADDKASPTAVALEASFALKQLERETTEIKACQGRILQV